MPIGAMASLHVVMVEAPRRENNFPTASIHFDRVVREQSQAPRCRISRANGDAIGTQTKGSAVATLISGVACPRDEQFPTYRQDDWSKKEAADAVSKCAADNTNQGHRNRRL